MPFKYLLAIDQGTTSCRTIIFDFYGKPQFISQEKLGQNYPQAGWVEQDLEILWQTQLKTIKECLSKVDSKEIASIGITNQRETIGLWNKNGQPLTPAISWQCTRTKDSLVSLKDYESKVKEITGLPINPYFSASKLQWLIQNNPSLKSQIEAGEVLAGTIDSWLLFKLTGGLSHFTDLSNASRTMLFDIRKGTWSSELLQLFQIPIQLMPKAVPSQFNYGCTHKEILGCELPIRALIGDQQAALYGHNCLEEGEAELTCGTGGFLLVNSGKEIHLTDGLLTSIAWQKENEEITYTQEAAILTMGSMIEWLKRIGLIEYKSTLDEQLEASNPENNILVMPTITGFGSPNWKKEHQTSIIGLTPSANGASILKATMQGLAFRVKQVVSLIPNITNLRLGGGLSQSNYFCQFLANSLQIPATRSSHPEATAWGAAALSSPIALQNQIDNGENFLPQAEKQSEVQALWESWIKEFHN
jgi:glycerol kinase